MRTGFRILAIVGGLAVLAVIAVAIALATIDVNAFAEPIRQRVREATGRELAFRAIALEPSLMPKFVLDDLAIGNPAWAKAPQLLTARRLTAQVALLPLLHRRLELVRFELAGPVIDLETDHQGRGNWVLDRSPAAKAGATGPAEVVPALGALDVGDFGVTDGMLTYRDGVTGKTTTVEIAALAIATRGPQSPVAVDFRGKVGEIPLQLKGELGALETLRQQRWPYPVNLRGEIKGRQVAFATKLTVTDGTYRFDEFDLAFGPNAVKGQLTATPGTPRPKLAFKLAAGTLSAAELPAPPGEAPAPKPAAAIAGHGPAYLFVDQPVSFAPLRSVDADGELTIGQLTLADGRRLERVRTRVTLHDARAEVVDFEAAAFGGTTRGQVTIDAARDDAVRIALRLDAKGLDLAALLAMAGTPREVKGGKTDVALDIAMRGNSPRQWASTVTGNLTATVGPATLANAKLDATPAFARLAEAVNPFRAVDATTELQCAVIRLPLANGVARIDRSIAMESKKVGVLASGTLDFRDESIDLAFRPKVRSGVPIDLVQFADLVRLRGTFAAPAVTLDAKASAETMARLGAAYASGGLSVLGESLVAHPTGDSGECAVALGRTPSQGEAAQRAAPANRPAPAVDDLAKSLGRLLHR